MFCAYCGSEMKDIAQFCPQCGKAVATVTESAPAMPLPQAAPKPTQASAVRREAQDTKQAGGMGKKPIIIAAVIAVAAVILVIAGVMIHNQMESDRLASKHALTIPVQVVGYNDATDTRIPVQVVGTDYAGNAVDELDFIDSAGTGVQLTAGEYDVSFPASPLTASGTFYEPPAQPVHVTVADTLEKDAAVPSDAVASSTFTAKDILDVTDEEIQKALDYAAQDTEGVAGRAEANKNAVTELIEQAKQELAEQQAAAQAAAEAAAAEAAAQAAKQAGYDAISGWWQIAREGGCHIYHCVGSTVHYYCWMLISETATYKGAYNFTATRIEDGYVSGTAGTYSGGCYRYSDMPGPTWNFYIFDSNPDLLLNEKGTTESFMRFTASNDFGAYDTVMELAAQNE